jgi:hypothetical protein
MASKTKAKQPIIYSWVTETDGLARKMRFASDPKAFDERYDARSTGARVAYVDLRVNGEPCRNLYPSCHSRARRERLFSQIDKETAVGVGSFDYTAIMDDIIIRWVAGDI